MSILRTILFIFITVLLASCQVKDGGSSDLVSGHMPTTNKFTLVSPSAKTYVAGETVTLDLKFPFDITVAGGSPTQKLKGGSNTR
jgi:hypothetical protein